MSITSAFKGKNDYEVHFIGLGNITRWNDLKHKLQCINNVLFISKLLDIALEYYYNHYSKEPIDIYKINTIDNDDIDNITLDPSPRSSKIVDEKPEPKTIVTHDDTSVNSNVKLCAYCDFDHSLLNCPLVAATNSYHVPDNVQLDEWSSSASAVRYSYASAPHCLKVRNCDANINNEEELGTVGVFCVARNGIAEYVALGPLVGRQVAAATIAIDCDMRHMHTMYKNDKRRRDTVEDEMREDKKKTERTAVETIHISSDSDMDSNWVRHVRPVGTRAERNVTTVQTGERLYLVTVRKLQFGEELRYWDDTHDVIATLTAISNGNSGTKKKVERKTACGGCGLRFTHTLHYRQHCLLHHDTGRSLAMRKYHCLVCGVAVVGKERMRRHAQQAHQGRGAYQCQYCGKYFLRRNYLDMHRRYGCGRNPQRAKPLCDLCGKEFCQPQKLKVHIKRMHSSEMEDVLREFQCKRCMKLLGSRAALQRHVKEVHEGKEQVQSSDPKENGESAAIVSNNSSTCTKCGKQFQNKSNLKIHMLTHSGVKPFKCVEGKGCTAAFTTKQCLQFHYRRVHGYQDGDNMPRIERIVDYTLEAYSGGANVPSPPTQQSQPAINASAPTPPNILSELNTEEPIPIPTTSDLPGYNATSTPVDTLVGASTGFIVSKGSKKWMVEQPVVDIDNGNSNNSDNTSSCGSAISLLVDEADVDDVIVMAAPQIAAVEVGDDGQDEDDESDSGSISCRSSNHHLHHNTTTTSATAQSASTASLLVEAALDSVCNTVPVTPTSQQHTPPPLSLSSLDTDNNTGQQLVVDGRTPSMSLYGNSLRAGSVSPLLPRYGGGGGGGSTGDNLALQLDLSIYKHYAATVVDTVVRKYGDGLSGGMRSIQQPTPTDIPTHQADHTIITTPTDRYMRFLDNPSLSLAPPRLDTNQYSPTTIDCTNQQHLLDTPIEPTRGDSTTNMDLLPLDTTKAKLDLSMYYDTALEEIRTRLAAYEAAAVANDMGKGMAGMYGVEQDAVGASGFLLDGVGEFRSFEPFVLQGGQSSPQGAGTSNADLQGLDMTSTGCRTNNITTQQYPSLSTTTITNNPSPCSSPGLTSYHHRFPPPPLHLNLDHHLQPPPRLYSPTLIDSTSSAAAAAAVVVADLSLRHHVAAAAAHHHVHAHAHSHHDGVFSTSAYSHSPPPNAGGVPSLGYPPPPQAPSGVYHPHYPQYY